MTTTEASGTSRSPTTMWQRAMERYIDDDKPDVIRRRQIESWTFAWQPDDHGHDADMMAEDDDDDAPVATTTTTTGGTATTKSTLSNNQPPPPPQKGIRRQRRKRIAGTLTWTGEYVRIQLHCTSTWQEEEEQDKAGEDGKGSDMNNNAAAGTRFIAKCSVTKTILRDDLVDAQQVKLQTKLVQRWKQQQEVGGTNAATSSSMLLLDHPDPVELFEVSIILGSSSEERGYWHEAACAAIQTILYTTADSSLEVFEFIIRYLPMVLPRSTAPGTTGTNDDDSLNQTTTTTQLADRAVLRLLEDATYDACAAEDSDTAEESLADLGLQDEAEADDNNNDNKDEVNDDDNGGGKKKKNYKKEAKRRKRG
jgi:hypothetical protein